MKIIVVWMPPDTIALFGSETGLRITPTEARRLIMRLDVLEQQGGGVLRDLGIEFTDGDEAHTLRRSLENVVSLCESARVDSDAGGG